MQTEVALAYNVKVLCAVGDFGNETFSLPQKSDSSSNAKLTTLSPYCTKHVLYVCLFLFFVRWQSLNN